LDFYNKLSKLLQMFSHITFML